MREKVSGWEDTEKNVLRLETFQWDTSIFPVWVEDSDVLKSAGWSLVVLPVSGGSFMPQKDSETFVLLLPHSFCYIQIGRQDGLLCILIFCSLSCSLQVSVQSSHIFLETAKSIPKPFKTIPFC